MACKSHDGIESYYDDLKKHFRKVVYHVFSGEVPLVKSFCLFAII